MLSLSSFGGVSADTRSSECSGHDRPPELRVLNCFHTTYALGRISLDQAEAVRYLGTGKFTMPDQMRAWGDDGGEKTVLACVSLPEQLVAFRARSPVLVEEQLALFYDLAAKISRGARRRRAKTCIGASATLLETDLLKGAPPYFKPRGMPESLRSSAGCSGTRVRAVVGAGTVPERGMLWCRNTYRHKAKASYSAGTAYRYTISAVGTEDAGGGWQICARPTWMTSLDTTITI